MIRSFAKHTTCLLFGLSIVATTSVYAQGANITPEERTKVEKIVHDYLLNKPEILVEAIQTLQRKQFEEAKKTVLDTQKDSLRYANQLLHQSGDPILGNPNGKISIVEFFDYQCTHCIHMAPVIAAIVKANPDVRIILKELPIRGPISDFAARAALAAHKQGKYHDLSLNLLTAAGKETLSEESILEKAKTLGLNVDQLKKDMHSKEVDEQIKSNYKLGQDLKLLGTPAFFIAKTDTTTKEGDIKYMPGLQSQEQLQNQINELGKRKKSS